MDACENRHDELSALALIRGADQIDMGSSPTALLTAAPYRDRLLPKSNMPWGSLVGQAERAAPTLSTPKNLIWIMPAEGCGESTETKNRPPAEVDDFFLECGDCGQDGI